MDSFLGTTLSFFLRALSDAAMPGPVLNVTISESAKRGFMVGPMIILGHGILGLFLLILLIVFGFANIVNRPGVIGVVGPVGSVMRWFCPMEC